MTGRRLWVFALLLVLVTPAHGQAPSSAANAQERREKTIRLPDILEALAISTCSRVADIGAGEGFFTARLARFDTAGKPALGDMANHFPANNAQYRSDLRAWFGREPNVQDVLDTTLGWAVLNNHFEVADFLLAHGVWGLAARPLGEPGAAGAANPSRYAAQQRAF